MSLAALLLFWRLDAIYLWQDEANTAVLAVRMLKFGKPLAYDGVNLLTNDNFGAEDVSTIGLRTPDPKAGVDYIIQRGDVKPDTSWIFHPWGQFVIAAISIRAFGQTTLAPRLPFAVAAFGTVLLLYQLVRRSTGSAQIALMSVALLVANNEWILHGRQARYYALSSLMLLVTLAAYERWRRGGRWGATVFVVSAWSFFQVDYGTVWPVIGVLFAHAFVVDRRNPLKPLLAGLALATAIAPFFLYYELLGRRSVQLQEWTDRFRHNVFNIDLYIVPVIVLIAACVLFGWRWRRLPAPERRLVGLGGAMLIALLFWVPTVAPTAYVRYIVMAAPIGCLVVPWTFVRAFPSRPAVAWAAVVVIAATPWLSKPLDSWALEVPLQMNGAMFRPEWSIALHEIFTRRTDPNRTVVEWLRQHADPTDEILVNYEDAPLMYYLPNPIRGGVAAFRAEDDAKGPPRFALMRRSVPFVHWPVFYREIQRYQWDQIDVGARDVIWGNNPDPMGKVVNPNVPGNYVIGRRRD